MTTMNPSISAKISLVLVTVLCCACAHTHKNGDKSTATPPAKQNVVVHLWPNGVPGKVADHPEQSVTNPDDDVTRLSNVSDPIITFFPAPGQSESPRATVIVCPGGGYRILSYNKEGSEICEFLNSIGLNAVLLKYRVPDNRDGAFMDAQRAMRLVRYYASDWNVDPDRLGIMGFSAGGHLSARLSTNFARAAYTESDSADKLPCNPNFSILIYPAYLYGENYSLVPEIKVDESTPPTFLAQSIDDRRYVDSSVSYFLALKAAGVPASFHIFATGGHGYGMRKSDIEPGIWPEALAAWLRDLGMTPQIE